MTFGLPCRILALLSETYCLFSSPWSLLKTTLENTAFEEFSQFFLANRKSKAKNPFDF